VSGYQLESMQNLRFENLKNVLRSLRHNSINLIAKRWVSTSSVPIGPATIRYLNLYKLQPEQIKGTGKKGRIYKHDVLNFVASGGKPSVSNVNIEKTEKSTKSTVSTSASNSAYEDIPNNNIRRVIAKRLTEAKQTIPHVYATSNVSIDQLMELRSALNNSQPIKLSVNDFVIRACALALKDVPSINASYDKNGQLILNSSSDISIAVASEKGLITPIVKNADSKGLAEISKNVKELSLKANEGKLQPNEFQGGSFSISNLGMFDIDEFRAVINPPQTAILAVGRGKKEVAIDPISNKPTVSTRIKVTLSFDQRAIDSDEAAKFLSSFKTYIENPHLLSGSANTNRGDIIYEQ